MQLPQFASFSIKQALRESLIWLDALMKYMFVKGRFIPASLPFLKKQLIYDRRSKTWIRLTIRNDVDYYVLRAIFTYHAYRIPRSRANHVDQLYERMVASQQVPLIIDCGANSGMATRYFKETYPISHIVAVEPDEDNLKLAEKNNSDGDVEFCLAGIGCDKSLANIVDPSARNWGYRTEVSDDGNICLMSVNDIITSNDNCTPFFIKIDIEGFENNLFSQNTEWIDKFPVLVIELHDWLIPSQKISVNFLRRISLLDRDFILLGENVFSISNRI